MTRTRDNQHRGRILVLGGHPHDGFSMRRYNALCVSSWKRAGYEVKHIDGTSPLLSRLSRGRSNKWLTYLSKYALSPALIAFHSRKYDLIHITDHSDSLWMHFISRRATSVITCHDVFAIASAQGNIPEHQTRLTGRIYQYLNLAGLKRATHRISVSQATARDLLRYCPRPLTVIKNPLDATLLNAPSTKRSLSLPNRYLLIIGPNGWRKRRDTAIQTWLSLTGTSPLCDADLVIVGPNLDHSESALIPSTHRNRIHSFQGTTDSELKEIYTQATATLVMSRYEGFAWPIIEAQALGSPVLATDAPVFRETGGKGAFYVDPRTMLKLSKTHLEEIACELLTGSCVHRGTLNAQQYIDADYSSALTELYVRLTQPGLKSALKC